MSDAEGWEQAVAGLVRVAALAYDLADRQDFTGPAADDLLQVAVNALDSILRATKPPTPEDEEPTE